MRKVWWSDFAASEFHGLDPMRTIAVFPTAAIEQHGPHLPLGTDSIINQGCLDLLIERLPAGMDVRILPMQQVGKSNEHIWQKGTLSLAAAGVIDAWTQVGLDVARAGIRKILFVNSHGGNVPVIEIVARELRVRADVLAVKVGWSHFWPRELYSGTENRFGIHGGDAETSLVMHFRPELVAHDRLADFPSAAEAEERAYQHLKPIGPLSYAWIASDLNPAGVVGEASKATPEKGRQTAEAAVAGVIEVLLEIERHPLPG